MGGGGVMTTAAKAGALGGYRSGLPLACQAAAAAARRTSRLPPATISAVAPTAEEGLTVPLLSSEKGQSDAPAVQAIQRQSWEIDDWEFASGEDELLDSLRPAPRLVFGPVPTLEEANDAMADLKDAVERSVEPCLKRKDPPPVPGKEILQSKKDRAKLDGMYE